MGNELLNVGLGIMTIGLAIGLPNLSTIIIDFTQFGTLGITMMRLGLLSVAFYFVAGGVE